MILKMRCTRLRSGIILSCCKGPVTTGTVYLLSQTLKQPCWRTFSCYLFPSHAIMKLIKALNETNKNNGEQVMEEKNSAENKDQDEPGGAGKNEENYEPESTEISLTNNEFVLGYCAWEGLL